MTAVVISQPQYFPWPGFFQLLSMADVYIHLDNAQFSKGGFTNRVQLKTAEGVRWLTIPLKGKGSFQPIQDLAAAEAGWRAAHRDALLRGLQGAPHLDQALDLFDQATTITPLAAALEASIDLTAKKVGLAYDRRIASELAVEGHSSRRVLDLVLRVGGDRYVTAHGAANYLDHEAFEREGVAVEYVDYVVDPWPQFHGPFTPFVTVLDLIAHCGADLHGRLQGRSAPWRAHLAGRTL